MCPGMGSYAADPEADPHGSGQGRGQGTWQGTWQGATDLPGETRSSRGQTARLGGSSTDLSENLLNPKIAYGVGFPYGNVGYSEVRKIFTNSVRCVR